MQRAKRGSLFFFFSQLAEENAGFMEAGASWRF